MMKECPGVNENCCRPICDWDSHCEDCKKIMLGEKNGSN
jgi:hypothetical protein